MGTLASDYADGMASTLADIWTAIDNGTSYEDYEGQDVYEYLDEMPLEIVNRRGAPFQVVLTIGGPDARIVAELDEGGSVMGDAHLEVHWGTDSARITSGAIRRTADYFAEMLEG